MEPVEILIVDDDAEDVLLTQESFSVWAAPHRFHRVVSGEEALALLIPAGGARAPRFDLIILDVKLPRLDGFELLSRLRGEDRWARTPVAMFTSSPAEEERMSGFDLAVTCYLTKPSRLAAYRVMALRLEMFYEQARRMSQLR